METLLLVIVVVAVNDVAMAWFMHREARKLRMEGVARGAHTLLELDRRSDSVRGYVASQGRRLSEHLERAHGEIVNEE